MSLGNLICCVKAGKITPLLKTKCLLDISRGMLFLHEASMIHRDLKGENILMASLDISAVANCKITGTTARKIVRGNFYFRFWYKQRYK